MTDDKIKELVEKLGPWEQIALVRCEAEKPFNGYGGKDGYKIVKALRALKLVALASWTCTERGRELVAYICGMLYRAPTAAPPKPGTRLKLEAHEETHRGEAPWDSLCGACDGTISRGEMGLFVPDRGFFHNECVEGPCRERTP